MSPYSHAPLLVGIIFLSLSLLVFFHKNRLMMYFCSMTLLSSLWQLSWAVLFNVQNRDAAEDIAKIGHVAIIFVPMSVYLFVASFFDVYKPFVRRTCLVASLSFMAILLSSDLLIDGVYQYKFGFYPKAGKLHPLFLTYIVFVCLNIFSIIFKMRGRSTADLVLIGGILVYIFSAFDFLVNYGVEFYPFGFVFLLFFLLLSLQAIFLRITNEIRDLNASLEFKVEEATEQIRRQQNELVQSAKLASIGVMAAGVAHELNNPINFLKPTIVKLINVCQGLLDIKNLSMPFVEPTAASKITEIEKNIALEKFVRDKDFIFRRSVSLIDKIQSISSGLNTFTRTTEGTDRTEVAVSSIVNDVIEIIPEQLLTSKSSQLKYEATSDFKIRCNVNQISQVLLNLVKNSLDAITSNGVVTIRSFLDEQGRRAVQVVDNGPGIPESVRDKIFDPFYTTKAPGSGTGLGLSISMEIVKNHNAEMKLESPPEGGAIFTITFGEA